MKNRKGKLLTAFQTYLLQVLYKDFPDEKVYVFLDSNGFWKEQEEKLMSLTNHLIEKTLILKKPMAFKKPLSPAERRLVHEKVSEASGVKSFSFGKGFYKNMKIIPNQMKNDKK